MVEEGHNPHGEEIQHEDHTGPTVVLFVVFGLLMGAVMREINKKTKMPYTPMLLMFGIFLGYMKDSLGVIGESTSIIQKLNPHMILLIFIPVLLFESAFNCDWYVFRKSLTNILILAGPGVLWGAILIGATFKLILAYPDQQLTWYQAFTLGCVLSATDPVAVVALLKQLGASVRFNTLVEGQSLMNDGTAMVFFMLFMDLAKGNSSSAIGVLANFVRIACGGPLLGIVFGFLMSFWLKRIIRDQVLTINITFVGAFLCFYVAQFTFIKVSGILALVVLGLYMSAVGKRKIYPQSQHALHNVWAYIQYSCETIIFILTGCVVGVQMLQQSTITGSDWLRMFLFWFLMIILRAVMVLTFYPLIKNIGYGLSKKEMVVLIYGGLRGALGMCLSLMIGFDHQLPIRFREITVFYMCGMAMLTIIVNGLTCGKVVNYVEMISYPQIKRKILKRSIRNILNATQQKLKELKNQPDMAYAKWKQVQEMADISRLGATIHERASVIGGKPRQERDSLLDIKKSQVVEEIRFKFTLSLHKIYWQLYQQGQISQQAVIILSNSCDIVNDEPNLKQNYFQILSRNFTMGIMKYYLKFKDTPIIGGFITRLSIQKLYFVYEIATAFLQSCQENMHFFTEKFPINNNQNLNYVFDQVRENMQLAINYINEIQNNYPTIIQAVHTSRAATVLLKYKKHYLKDMYSQGFIDQNDYSALRKEIDVGLVHIQTHNFKLQEVRFNQVLTECPLFSCLSNDQLLNIRVKSSEQTFEKGTIIQTKGKQLRTVSFIVSGTVKQQFQKFSMIRGIGCVLDPYDFIYRSPSQATIKATTTTKVMQIQEKVIMDLLDQQPQFKKKWYKSTFGYALKFGKGMDFLEKSFSARELRRFIQSSEVVILKPGVQALARNGAYLFQGQVQSDNGQTYSKGNFISQNQNRSIKAMTNTTVLIFNSIVSLHVHHERISTLNDQ